MGGLPASYYRRGDKVMIRTTPGQWAPGRVISTRGRWYVKVAHSISNIRVEGLRWLPVGTPVYDTISCREVRLVAHDPEWDPYAIVPFMTPPQYAVLGGVPGFATPGIPGLQHIGAYIPGPDYGEGDPVWAWEKEGGWRQAVVILGQRSWVSVRFLNGYRTTKGQRSKSYRPAKVWPALCDYPEPVMQITLDAEWAEIGPGRNPGL